MERYFDRKPVVLGGFYTMSPAPRSNPEGRLDGAWVVKYHLANVLPEGRVVIRFQTDGRDMAEAWLAYRHLHRVDQQCSKCQEVK